MDKKRKPAEWVDTNNKAFYVSYKFPISITNRCWIFWANLRKGWRKIFNLASALAKRNRLSIVFLYGEIKSETLANHLAKLNNSQLIILRADYVANEAIEIIDNSEEWLKGLQKSGGRRKGEDGEFLFDVSDSFLEYSILDPVCKENYNKFLMAKEAIEQIKNDVETNGYSVLGSVSSKRVRGSSDSITGDLLDIVKEIYPYGVESESDNEFAYKRAAVSRLIEAGLAGQTENNLVGNLNLRINNDSSDTQLSLFGYSISANAFIDFIHEWCDSALKEKGYFKTSELFYELTKAPYGMYECNYYYYLYAYAFRKYTRGLFYGDQNMHTKEADTVYWCRDNIFYPTIFNQTEKQRHFVKRFCKLFDIEEDIHDLPKAVQYARSWTTVHICCDTVDRISHTLFEILSKGFEGEHYTINTERYDDWLTDDKYDYLYAKLRTVDTDFKARLEMEYGKEKTALYWKFFYWKGSAVSWLHKKENVDEKVEHYMKQVICRECGNMIQPLTTTGLSYEAIETIDGKMETREFTVKQVLGLNKKYFGRYQNEYFCIPCMCEILGLTAFELWDKMHQFKEAGCELF